MYILGKKKISYLILVVLIIKTFTAFYLSDLAKCSAPSISLGKVAVSSGDTFSYTFAKENYISKGEYFFFNGKEKVYAGRLPHYSIPYFLFRMFLDIPSANDALMILQIIIDSIATILFSLLAYNVIKTNLSFYLAYFF